MPGDSGDRSAQINYLTEIGIALSTERDIQRLLENILASAKILTAADGGTIYSVADNRLVFEIMSTDSLGVALGGSTGVSIPFDPIPLYEVDGSPNTSTVVASSVFRDMTINIPDTYRADGFDFSGTRKFDEQTGYRTRSILTVPLKNHENEIIGVLQLINALDRVSGETVPFSVRSVRLAESLASQAAVALTNRKLIDDLNNLFDAFIKLIATEIDEKSPYTGGHCRRVPELTMLLAEAASRSECGELKDFRMNDKDRHEVEVAAWLHDCGKITTPEHVMDKSTKLETIFDRMRLVDARFDILRRDAEIRLLRELLARHGTDTREVDSALAKTRLEFIGQQSFLRRCNIGGETMSADDQAHVREIGAQRFVDGDGVMRSLLGEDEVYNLTIPKGTLNDEERAVINRHIVATIRMLESLPFPKHLQHVPEYAGGHHEHMDGSGYPRGLTREEMSVPARVVAIADVFEALTAKDRPYKPGKRLSECLEIMGRMMLDSKIDPDLFRVFVSEKVYLRYAEQFLDADQIDEVDETRIPGYTP
jgi:HD-GYP domain-containing protein (c-di-GMP phosphodiesterase class II)